MPRTPQIQVERQTFAYNIQISIEMKKKGKRLLNYRKSIENRQTGATQRHKKTTRKSGNKLKKRQK